MTEAEVSLTAQLVAVGELLNLADLCSTSKYSAVRAVAEACAMRIDEIITERSEPYYYTPEEMFEQLKTIFRRLEEAKGDGPLRSEPAGALKV